MGSRELSAGERSFLERLSRLATANPFLPERIDLERQILEDAFEEGSPVWSKRLDRRNPNVVKLEARATAAANEIREKFSSGTSPTDSERRLFEELVFYTLYYRFEEEFYRAMTEPSVRFYEPFCREAVRFLSARISSHRSPIGSRSSSRFDAPRTTSSSSSWEAPIPPLVCGPPSGNPFSLTT